MKAVLAKKANMTNDEFKNYYEALTKFIDLLGQVPNFVSMPLFNVDCRGVKDELRKTISE